MKIVGLTGGIGSGKSTVLNEFKDLGIKTYSADNAAKTLINSDRALIDSIKKVFGNNIYKKNKLDTKQLSKIVFQDSDKLEVLRPCFNRPQTFPLYSSKVSAGFPSPADDNLERSLDLNSYLIKRPAATFFVRVNGDSMINAGINDNDILVVDRSIKPAHGKVIIAVLDGQMTVKRLYKRSGKIILMPENDLYKPIEIEDHMNMEIWGVVTSSVHFL